ncbi:FtsW/RodA/SpoVE family cell cycle protein [Hominifimenecus sp. rT4P-3]|uniref:FtsW/RodA/SpoVE family cell cycle protein n=1 Tax=Hominifimenecus sp. rT4P-3 TaxID=3242979 RepID=UPI003DA2D2E1
MEKEKQANKKKKSFYDYSLLFVIIFLSCFGLIMIYSTSYYTAQLKLGDSTYYLRRQAMILLGSFAVMIFISKIDYHFWTKFVVFAYLASVIMMVLVNFTPLGREVNGKKRWLGISDSISFQPTEFVKIALILVTACVIVRLVSQIDNWRVAAVVFGLAIPPGLLVLMNNLSSGIIIFGIVFVMYFVASKKTLRFAIFVGGFLALAFLAIPLGEQLVKAGVLQSYQLDRIHVWQNPEAFASEGGFQVLQGLYAIGSGGLFGKGLGNSIQKLGFVPEAQNDMIFSIICEELGLFGAACLMLLFLFMLHRFLIIANNAPDLLGALIVTGAMGHIAIQVILNIAVVTNSIPNTGITLPFISYGGTSLLFLMAEMGLVLGVSNQITLETL